MSFASKFRKWVFPSKEDNFDVSYDLLIEFFKTLDAEFSGTIDFLYGLRIDRYFITETEMNNTVGEDDEVALYTKDGSIYRYDAEANVWNKIDQIQRLPKIRHRNPTQEDLVGWQIGDAWLNIDSGEAFKLSAIMTEVIRDQEYKYAIWVNSEGNCVHYSKFLFNTQFFPGVDFKYRTKQLVRDAEGNPSWDENNPHMAGTLGGNNQLQYFSHDTHADLYIHDTLVGTLILNRKRVQTLMDLDMFNPEGGLPAHNEDEINQWYMRFERLLAILELSTIEEDDNSKTLRTDIQFPFDIKSLIWDGNNFNYFLDINRLLSIPTEEMRYIKETYRAYFAAVNDQQMSMEDKLYAIYLLGTCVAWEAYDGNIYYINGNEMLADGNIEPEC